jgi:hypothetical protein
MNDHVTPSPTTRLPGESEPAFAAFLLFRDLGRDRTVVDAYRQFTGNAEATQASGAWNRWAKAHRWAERALAFDRWLQAARDRIAAREAVKWERRRQEALERGWEASRALWAKADAMLDAPLATERTEGNMTVITPARWTFGTLARIARAAAELEVAVLTATAKDPADMSDAELAALLAIEDAEISPMRGTPDQGSAGA